MTAVERLADYVRARYQTNEVFENLVTNLIHREKEQRTKAYNIGYEDGKCNHINDADNYINDSDYINQKDEEPKRIHIERSPEWP
jgi:hypothetical protein